MNKADSVFEAMTVGYRPCEICMSKFGRSWPVDEPRLQIEPHDWYCVDCLQLSLSSSWMMCVDGKIRSLLTKQVGEHTKMLWRGGKGDQN